MAIPWDSPDSNDDASRNRQSAPLLSNFKSLTFSLDECDIPGTSHALPVLGEMTMHTNDSSRTYEVFHDTGTFPIKSWTVGVPFEPAAKAQLQRIAALPFIHKWVAAMPDVHQGIGATVGSVIPTHGAVIPAAVGVDIGCGMMAVKTSLTARALPDDLHALRSAIEAAVPHGRTDNGGRNDKGAWSTLPRAQ